jgi:hypothetical protein
MAARQASTTAYRDLPALLVSLRIPAMSTPIRIS